MRYDKTLDWLAEDKLDNYMWLIDTDKKTFMKKRIKSSFIEGAVLLLIISAVLYFTNNITFNSIFLSVAFVLMMVYLNYKSNFWKLKSKFKAKRDNVYKAFPLWISTLEILIVTNNIPNTFKKSIETCPKALRADLISFVDKIQYDPENKSYYKDFLSRYDIDEINEIIMDMYAFNRLNKNEIILEFKNLNKRLNEMSARIRKNRQNTDLFFISALNSLPLFTLSIYILLISMLMNIA